MMRNLVNHTANLLSVCSSKNVSEIKYKEDKKKTNYCWLPSHCRVKSAEVFGRGCGFGRPTVANSRKAKWRWMRFRCVLVHQYFWAVLYFQLVVDFSALISWMGLPMNGFNVLVVWSYWKTMWLSDHSVAFVTCSYCRYDIKRAPVRAGISSSSGRIGCFLVGTTCIVAVTNKEWSPETKKATTL